MENVSRPFDVVFVTSGTKGFFVGALTGGLETCITYPTEFIKTQVQLDQKVQHPFGAIKSSINNTLRRNGILGFYRGLNIILIGTIPRTAVLYASFEHCKSLYMDRRGSLNPAARVYCGMAAGMCESFILPIMDTVKVKFVDDQKSPNPKFRGLFHGINLIVKEKGVQGLYQGLGPTLLKQSTSQAIRFFIMESLKELYKGKDKSPAIPKYVSWLIGSTAGCITVLSNTPVDVVKTRMQGLQSYKYKNSFDCFFKVIKYEGFFALYKGALPRFVKHCIGLAISFTIYDSFMDVANKMFPGPLGF